jgi:hypothetical protein
MFLLLMKCSLYCMGGMHNIALLTFHMLNRYKGLGKSKKNLHLNRGCSCHRHEINFLSTRSVRHIIECVVFEERIDCAILDDTFFVNVKNFNTVLSLFFLYIIRAPPMLSFNTEKFE